MVNNQQSTVIKSNSQSSIINSQSIVFFGSGDFVIPVVEKLVYHGLDLVITNDKNPNSNLQKFCQENNIKTIFVSPDEKLINHQPLIINHSLAVLASFGAFIPDEIINSFKYGIINIHPSLLPKYKGPSPVQYAILNGETKTGVTLIKLDDQIDHGPILSQKTYNLSGNESTQELLNILFEIGADMVEEQIIKIEKGEKLSETPQNHSEEYWSYRIEKKDGQIDLYNLQTTTYKLDNMIRAFFPWPTVWFRTILKGQEKLIKLLPEGKIQVEGKNPMSYKDFINGYEEEGKEILEKLNLI